MNWKRTSIVRDANFQTREADGNLIIDGYFALFNSEYWVLSNAFETIDPGAFNLETDADVRALTNHDTTLVLGRTTAGTLQLRTDENGLFGSVLINPNDQDAVNLYERVKRGDVSQCSFGFDILDERKELLDDGTVVWHLRQVRLYEVSVCTFPAYKDTAVQARASELENERARNMEIWRADALARIRGKAPEQED